MKLNFFTLLFCILGFTAINAQNNGDFENWSAPLDALATLIEPDGYLTTNIYAFTGAGGDPTSVIQSSDAVSGSSSALMEVKVAAANISQIMLTGAYDNVNNSVAGTKEPFTDMPENLFGSHKANLMGTDSAAVLVTLTRWDMTGDSAITVGVAEITAEGTVADWTNFTAPFAYAPDAMAPDSMEVFVIIYNAAGAGMQTVGSTYQIDGLNMMNSVGIFTPINQEISLTTFPNPTTDVLNFDFGNEPLENMSVINIVTTDGKLVRSHQVLDSREAVNVSDLTEGTYYYQVLNDKGYTVAGAPFNVFK